MKWKYVISTAVLFLIGCTTDVSTIGVEKELMPEGWKELPFKAPKALHFESKRLEKGPNGNFEEHYETDVFIKTEKMHVYCEHLVWKPYEDEIRIKDSFRLYVLKGGDTTATIGGTGATFSSDFTSYTIDQMNGMFKYSRK